MSINLIQAEIVGRDLIEMTVTDHGVPVRVRFVGCDDFAREVKQCYLSHGPNPKNWPLPLGTSHSALLLKEFILKCQGKWQEVYTEQELCHCRMVQAQTVEQAILCGAHTSEAVSRWTSAGTACGTCKPTIEQILEARLLD